MGARGGNQRFPPRSYAAAASRANALSGRGTSCGCRGGTIAPRSVPLKVGQGDSSTSAHSWALWK
jgi:hypothetical protein